MPVFLLLSIKEKEENKQTKHQQTINAALNKGKKLMNHSKEETHFSASRRWQLLTSSSTHNFFFFFFIIEVQHASEAGTLRHTPPRGHISNPARACPLRDWAALLRSFYSAVLIDCWVESAAHWLHRRKRWHLSQGESGRTHPHTEHAC